MRHTASDNHAASHPDDPADEAVPSRGTGGPSGCRMPSADFRLLITLPANWQSEIANRQSKGRLTMFQNAVNNSTLHSIQLQRGIHEGFCRFDATCFAVSPVLRPQCHLLRPKWPGSV